MQDILLSIAAKWVELMATDFLVHVIYVTLVVVSRKITMTVLGATFDELCEAVPPLVAPATLCPCRAWSLWESLGVFGNLGSLWDSWGVLGVFGSLWSAIWPLDAEMFPFQFCKNFFAILGVFCEINYFCSVYFLFQHPVCEYSRVMEMYLMTFLLLVIVKDLHLWKNPKSYKITFIHYMLMFICSSLVSC